MGTASAPTKESPREVYYGKATLFLNPEGQKHGGFLGEFRERIESKPIRNQNDLYQVVDAAVANSENKAYRRFANLIDAKIGAGGWSSHTRAKDIEIELAE